jgi:glycosyltransferase involved in cell wall biosynthesis
MKIKVNLAFNAGRDIEILDLTKNRGIGGTEYAVLMLALHLSECNLIDVIIITKYELKINKKYNFEIEKNIYIDNIGCSIIPEAYINEFRFNDNKKIIIWLHHPTINVDKIDKKYKNLTYVALNYSQVRTFKNKCKKPIYVIKSFYQFIKIHNRDSDFLEINAINFGYLGILRPEKGLHHVASYWREIVKLYPNSKLHIVGSPIPLVSGLGDDFYNNLYVKKISKIVGRKYLKTIKFYGRIEDLNEFLPNIDIGLLNPFSSTEAYPDSILKFYEYGIPVISGMFNGSSDLLRINSTLQFPNIDPVKAVDKIIKNKKLYLDSQIKALEFVKSHDNNEITETWKNLIISLDNNELIKRENLLFKKDKFKNNSIKEYFSIIKFRIKYTLTYKVRVLINGLFCK